MMPDRILNRINIEEFWAHFLLRKKPGYPLVSFLPAAKKDTASIPCAEDQEHQNGAWHHRADAGLYCVMIRVASVTGKLSP
jgi:hypothetical protein